MLPRKFKQKKRKGKSLYEVIRAIFERKSKAERLCREQ
jgi:hypothetical protein